MQRDLRVEDSCVAPGHQVIDDVGTLIESSEIPLPVIVVMVKLSIRIHKIRDLGKDEHVTIEGAAELALFGVALPWSRSRRVPRVEFVEHEAIPCVGFAG